MMDASDKEVTIHKRRPTRRRRMGGSAAVRILDIIRKKRLGLTLEKDEIEAWIRAYVAGEVDDSQVSALAMAICLQGMDARETADLTLAMAQSGQTLDWSDIPGVKLDKHSTGGVGDTTTLVLAPLVAAAGVPIAKMSGRGLGHTGGTIDKLASIPGFRTDLPMDEFRAQVRRIGVAVGAQTADLAPADKKLYALRDVTETVESIPLIASSIMSKKLASGADAIVLDVKVGEGAFMKDLSSARTLARTMVSIGQQLGRRTVAVLTQMEQPLGRAIGNALEVREAVATLRGQGPADLTELCLVLGAEMVVEGGKARTSAEARTLLEHLLATGEALTKFRELVGAQGGDPRVADDLSLLPAAPVVRYMHAPAEGIIQRIHAEALGRVAMRLGAGRSAHDDVIDPAVGLVLLRSVGESVLAGEALIEIHAATEAAAAAAALALHGSIEIGPGEPFTVPLVLGIVRDGGTASDPVSELGAAETSPADHLPLLQHARQAREAAYAPYSHFAVGAAVQVANGEVFTGANVENASYGLTNCAERSAVFATVTGTAYRSGERIVAIAVVADSDGAVAPCGACRQVLAEFCAPDVAVVLSDMSGHVRHTTVGDLLPHAFGPAQMYNNR